MKRFWVGLLNGLLCLAVCIALGLALVLGCDWLYRADIRLLDIPARSGLTEPVILENYRAAVGYLAPWNDAGFALRGLAWTAAGAEFFRRLRIAVLCTYILGLAGGVGLICLHGARHRLGRKVWNVSGAISLGLVAVLGVLMALDFDRLQQGFCGLLFGDTWQLYEDLDPVVTIFPQSYFVHAGFLLVFLCVAGCLLQFAAGYTPAPAAPKPPRQEAPPPAKMPQRTTYTAPGRTAPQKQVYRKGDQ